MILKRLFPFFIGGSGAIALLLLRVVTGVAFMMHGWPKIHNPLAWMGPQSPVPGVFQALAATAEFFGGMGLVVGLLTPIAALGILSTMVVAFGLVHIPMGNAFVVNEPGRPSWEIVGVYFAVAATLMLVGPGKLSLDYFAFGRNRCARNDYDLENVDKRPPRLVGQ